MRQASGDLFPSDSPIPASQMIGRRDDVREIATRLEAGTHLVVAGPPYTPADATEYGTEMVVSGRVMSALERLRPVSYVVWLGRARAALQQGGLRP